MVRRSVSLSLLIVFAVPWATGWTLLGLWLLFFAGASVEVAGLVIQTPMVGRVGAGTASMAAGQLVFLCFVADRVYPRAHRVLVWPIEVMVATALFLGLATAGIWMLGAAG